MKALQKILPAKRLTLIQNIVCMVVMLAIVGLSFGTIFTAKIEQDDETQEMFDEVMTALDFDEDSKGNDVKLPKEVNVSAPFVIKSFVSIADVVKNLVDVIGDLDDIADDANDLNDSIDKAQNDKDLSNAKDNVDDINDKTNKLESGVDSAKDKAKKAGDAMKSDGFVGLIALILAVVQAFSQNVILGIVYVILIFTVITLPLIMAIKFIIALVSFLKNLKDPGKAYPRISKSFRGMFAILPTLWMYKILAPQMTFGAPVIVMLVLCIVVLVINLLASRIKSYTPEEFSYINVLQGVSVVSVIGYFLFMLNIGKAELFAHIWDGIGSFIEKAKSMDVLLAVIAVLAIVVTLIPASKLITKFATRLCCMVPTGKKLAKDTYIVSAAFALILVIAPIFLMEGKFNMDLGKNGTSFILASVGIVLMLAGEIAMPILKKSVCKGTTSDDIHAVLTGCPAGIEQAEYGEEAPAAEEAVAEEAVAEEAVAEEAVAEEAATEEAAEEEAAEEETKSE